jgi:hypothetical protein
MLRLDFAHQPSATHVLCRLDGVLESPSMYTAAHTADSTAVLLLIWSTGVTGLQPNIHSTSQHMPVLVHRGYPYIPHPG